MKIHEKRCEMHPNRKLANKRPTSKKLNKKEKSKILKIESKTLISDNANGENHCNYSDTGSVMANWFF